MIRVGIWERGEGLYEAVREALRESKSQELQWVRGEHPAAFVEYPLDLLVVSPNAIGWAGAGAISSRIVLLNGGFASLARALHAESAVSYGSSPKDTLTLSSLEGDRLCAALQRELVTVEGRVVERQELVLPFRPGTAPDFALAVVGALLLLGQPGDPA